MSRTKGAFGKDKVITPELETILDGVIDGMPEDPPAETALSTVEEDKDPWFGLSTRQRKIQLLKLRGISQAVIGQLCGISQAMVFKELTSIRKIHKEKGVNIDKQAYIGEAVSVYEEIAIKAWNEFYEIPKDNPLRAQMKMQTLNLIANMQEKKTKMLVDLGLLEKAVEKHEHSFAVKGATIVDNWAKEGRVNLANAVLEAQLKPLEEPVPPVEDITDAEFTESDTDDDAVP